MKPGGAPAGWALVPTLLLATALAGCAATPAPLGTLVPEIKFAQSVVPGRTTRTELLAMFGKTKTVVFDSGYEAWLYQSPAGNGELSEFVILVDPHGVVKKTRRRPPSPWRLQP